MKVAIIGAGITGLTTAFRLAQRGAEVVVYEASDRVGGAFHSERTDDGFLVERGPHTIMTSNPHVLELASELGLDGAWSFANEESNKRYVIQDGRPKALPMSPGDFLTSDIWTTAEKLRFFGEALVPGPPENEESVSQFVKRRLGDAFLDYGFELLINGIWAGDPDKLSARWAFGKVWAIEKEHGSLIRGGIERQLAAARSDAPRAPRPKMVGFHDGNGILAVRLGESLGDSIRLESSVRSVERTDGGWHIDARRGRKKVGGTFDAVVTTAGPEALQAIEFGPVDAPDASFLSRVSQPPIAIVSLFFRDRDVEHPLDGFGMIAPLCEGLDILGVIFASTLFPGRAPEGHVALSCFVGGARRPELIHDLDKDQRRARVLRDLRSTLGVRGEPVYADETVWNRGIPQYNVGWGRMIKAMDDWEAARPNVYLSGNLRDGVAVPDLIAAGYDLAARIESDLLQKD